MGKRAVVGGFVAGIFVLGACNSGASGSGAAPTIAPLAPTSATAPRPSTKPTPTTAKRTATAKPDDGFAGDTVAAPKITNTGTDYAAIVASLARYGSWLDAHHPDPALVDRMVATGSDLHNRLAVQLTQLRHDHVRLVETDGDQPTKYTIISVTPDAISVRLVQDIRSVATVNAAGAVTVEHRYPGPEPYLALLVLVRGHWYLEAFDPYEPANVRL